jgi:hypothetical protein
MASLRDELRAREERGDQAMSVQTISTDHDGREMSARTRDRLLNVISPLASDPVELCARPLHRHAVFRPFERDATMVEMLRSGELVTPPPKPAAAGHGAVGGAGAGAGIAMDGTVDPRAGRPLVAATYPSRRARSSVAL